MKYSSKKTKITLILITIILLIVVPSFYYFWDNLHHNYNKNIWLGVETMELNPTISNGYNININRGLLVTRVFISSPAQIAKIFEGDVILRWNGKSITSHKEFKKLLYRSHVNDKVKLIINRNNMNMVIIVTLGARPGVG